MPKSVGIILVNYKDYAKRFLDECRDSMRAQTYPRDRIKFYIVDNCSSEESKEYLRDNFEEAAIIPRLDGNYCAANNAGLKRAHLDGCEYFVIANMDAKFDPRWLEELVLAMESSEKIGAAQSKILLYPKTEAEWQNPMINSLGNLFHFLGFGFTDGYNTPDRNIEGYPELKGYASGCSLILKKEVLDAIGGYNEEYYMYHDDLELGWKIKLAGYEIVLAPHSIAYHKYEFNRSVKMVYYMERNRYLAIYSYYKLGTILLIFPAILAMDLGMLFYSFPGGWAKEKLRVYLYFLQPRTWRSIQIERRRIRRFRRRKDCEIVKGFSGKVLFQEINNPVLEHIANPVFNLYWSIMKRIIIW